MGSVVTLQNSPAIVFRTVADAGRPVQLVRSGQRHGDRRAREFLTPDELAKLIAVARKNRHGNRDSLMVMLAYRRALRSAELVALEWSQVDFPGGWLTVNRIKNGADRTDDEKATDAGAAIVDKYFWQDATEPTWAIRFWREMANHNLNAIKDPDERLRYLTAWETQVRTPLVDRTDKYAVRGLNVLLQALAEWRLRQQQ